MQAYFALPEPPLAEPCNLAIGNFDGVHRGHQALLRAMIADARVQGRAAGLLTFDPHPIAVMRPEQQHLVLTTPAQRLAVLADVGLDFVVVYPFTRVTAHTDAAVFMTAVQQAVQMRSLWVGPDFALGRNRSGDISALRALGETLGYRVQVIEPQLFDGEEVRSGRIRTALLAGEVEDAARQLGRAYVVTGTVVAGAQRGRSIGFPTANLAVPPQQLLPANGVYATWATLADGQPRASVTNVGVRPSFDHGHRTVETFLLDFSGDLYDQPMTLTFVARLRPELRFASVDALKQQIAQDVLAARGILTVPPQD